MMRVVIILVGVAVFDLMLVFLVLSSGFNYSCTAAMRLVDVREHPTAENLRAYENIRDVTEEAQRKGRFEFGSAALMVTAAGCFIAGRLSLRREKVASATPYT